MGLDTNQGLHGSQPALLHHVRKHGNKCVRQLCCLLRVPDFSAVGIHRGRTEVLRDLPGAHLRAGGRPALQTCQLRLLVFNQLATGTALLSIMQSGGEDSSI